MIKRKNRITGLALLLLALALLTGSTEGTTDNMNAYKGSALNTEELPNIIIILSDDQGYGDVSFHQHPKEVSTPGIDKLAKEGIVFTNGYASAYVCAPTRAGLLTGRYQQRFGFFTAADSRKGMPRNEITLADILSEKGYATGIFGKWHLGLEPDYRPLQRGFDNFYGFLGHGAHDYFDLTCSQENKHNCIYRDNEIIEDEGYLTDNLAREACSFIKSNAGKEQPFFLYLPFNAVHWPLQAPEKDVKRYNTGNPDRDIYLGMLYRMDKAIQKVIKTLKKNGVYDNSLIFYFSDNGGANKVSANNLPLRDFKQSTYEGGIRVPFVVSWPSRLSHKEISEPVISLDILPSICDVLDIELPDDRVYDGRSLWPVIEGKQKSPLHEYLFWDGNDDRLAVRNGKWKLVKMRGAYELYDLSNDLGETTNLADKHPEITSRLIDRYVSWRYEMGEPMRR